MTEKPVWINSLGGLYVCLPESVMEAWLGGVEEDEYASEESTDYWKAGQIGDVAGVYSFRGLEALVLAASKGPVAYSAQLDAFVQKMAETQVPDVIDVVSDAFEGLAWTTVAEWNSSSDLVIFDAVWPGSSVPRGRIMRLSRPPGKVDVQVADVTPGGRWNIWVTVYRFRRRLADA